MTTRAPLFAVLASALLALLFFFLLWRPSSEELQLVRDSTVVLEAERSALQNEVVALREVERNAEQIRSALARLEEFIPTGPAQATIIRQFQLAADAAGVEIANVNFAPPTAVEEAPPTGTPETVLATIPVTMVVEGGYFQAVDFFRRLEVDIPRAVLITDLSLTEAEETFPVVSTTWTGDLFSIVPAAAVPVEPTAPAPADGAEGTPGEGTPEEGAPAEGDGSTTPAPAATAASATTTEGSQP